ncbi:MAG: bifunctional 23S rRNA (guanine(2069)-N(7))-methyltransferase RlmK/23S rRNA (guanine(2445)-N(2))-methyltransferase RlmL [Actinobacteria bacterium]|nr:bifunctional 23S rRNA (guanine(2069)-N(7))-methyltransferase RlmK/23S rRNA (guanine(2445)-N(2))-methyltransferase RlmL [Actinomycetota bacterium]
MTVTAGALGLFATAARGLEPLLVDELRALGATGVKEARAGCRFSGGLETAYRACLWSRFASRVLLPLAEVPAGDPDALYEGVRLLEWERHLDVAGTVAVDVTVVRSPLSHTHFAALRVKDAIVDRFRDRTGGRPSIDLERPGVRVNVHAQDDTAMVSLDLSGAALHRRGYREQGSQVAAPLKESLAAAVLVRAGWPDIAASGGPLVDPMCGSGTLPIEAALLAGDVAPGLLRDYWGFLGWKGHDAALWERLLAEAGTRRDAGRARIPPIYGFDSDRRSVRLARTAAERAGLRGAVRFSEGDLSHLEGPPVGVSKRAGGGDADGGVSGAAGGGQAGAGGSAEDGEEMGAAGAAPGLVVVNPPYGERLGSSDTLGPLYAELGRTLREGFLGWRAAVLTSDLELGLWTGLRAHKTYALYNGAIAVKLLLFDVVPGRFAGGGGVAAKGSAGRQMLADRLRKNEKHLRKWARREAVTCYRLYDADLPEYAVAVDVYEDRVHVQEYQAPPTVDPRRAQARLRDVIEAVAEVLDFPADRIFLKVRRKQSGTDQYGRLSEHAELHEVGEGGLRFLVDFTSRLDTGLFLDHRMTRALIRDLARGTRFLNLFSYTGAATVYAAAGGAATTTSVDQSARYLEWAARNLALNGLASGAANRLLRADCLEWIRREPPASYDLVFLDPPTFSNSSKMGQATLDVQRDHVDLIRATTRLLASPGTLIFSTNRRRFRLDAEALADLRPEDVTQKTTPPDFQRGRGGHSCWIIRRGDA